jgi:hypothetical protein
MVDNMVDMENDDLLLTLQGSYQLQCCKVQSVQCDLVGPVRICHLN